MPFSLLKNKIIISIISSFILAAFSLESEAQSKSLSEKIDQYLQAKMKKSLVPGMAVAVVQYDFILLLKGYGETSDNQSVTADTSFPIASLSKAFTATAILQLVDEGKVDLDSPVLKYLPSLKMNDDRIGLISVRQLLNQTSGLSDTGFPELTFDHEPTSSNEAITQMNEAKLTDTPGQKFHYHNPNFRLLAAIVESVSGKKFSDFMKERVFSPLGMDHTDDYSMTSSFYDNEQVQEGHIYFLGKSLAIKDPEWFVDGAAGIVSTANDMTRWLSMQTNKGNLNGIKLLSAASLQVMQSTPGEIKSRYGMGWFVGSDSSLYHNGILWTYSTEEFIDTRNGYGIVLLFNGGINPYVDNYSFLQGIIDILNQKEPEISSVSDVVYPIGVGVVLLILIALLIRSIIRVKVWRIKYQQRARWKSWLYMSLRLIPLSLLIFLPMIITSLSGRVLSWNRIFLMAPDIIIGLIIISLLNLIVVGQRIIQLTKV